MMKTERIVKKNNLIESGSIDYGPSRKDLNHNHGGFDLNQNLKIRDQNHELEVAEVDEEPKSSPFYRSSVFHLDDKNESNNTDDANSYSTSEAPLKHLPYKFVACKTGPSQKDLNHNLKRVGLNISPVDKEMTPEIEFIKVFTPFIVQVFSTWTIKMEVMT